MATNGVVLGANVTATTGAVTWPGGRAVLVLAATTYPGTLCSLQLQAPNGTWITLNGTTFSANQVTPFDLPAGQYRIFMSGTAAVALYANLVGIPYT